MEGPSPNASTLPWLTQSADGLCSPFTHSMDAIVRVTTHSAYALASILARRMESRTRQPMLHKYGAGGLRRQPPTSGLQQEQRLASLPSMWTRATAVSTLSGACRNNMVRYPLAP